MLVLSRKLGERVHLIDRETKEVIATVLVVDIDRNKIRLGLQAEQGIQIYREEILPAGTSVPGRPETPPGGG